MRDTHRRQLVGGSGGDVGGELRAGPTGTGPVEESRGSADVRERYLDAALAIIVSDRPLTLHRLGKALGRSHTALYWHFTDLDDLVAALIDREFAGAVTGSVRASMTPREGLVALAVAVRAAFHANPRLAARFIRLPRPGQELASASTLMLRLLRGLDLKGEQLATAYQALESVIIGTSVYDFERAPEHLALRRARFTALDDPAFVHVTTDDAAVDAHNDRGFRFAIEALLDASERTGSGG
jgi:AcrR family transcriptional regulator